MTRAVAVSDFQVVIGLEVHAQLLTATKIFCGCSTDFGGEPNSHVCPICLGMPGVLPALNARVVELAVKTGLALGCAIQPVSVFARKNYFYPDLPKGYQISQYELPICLGGGLAIGADGGEKLIRLTRIHMEEDAGKSLHEVAADGSSGVDLNRAGVPLLEIVSEPDLRSAEEAVEYLKALRAILMALGVNDGNLEEGSFRCDANVSVMRRGATSYGTRAEIKNMNSFRFLRQAIDFEVRRQVELVEAGQPVVQETRLYDPARGETRSMRSKEEAQDYRYFPEPDLPPVRVDEAMVARLRAELPELPRARSARYQRELGLSAQDAGVLVGDGGLAGYFEAALAARGGGAGAAKQVANWLIGELSRLMKETGLPPGSWKLPPAQLAGILELLDAGTINGAGAKLLVEELFRHGGDAAELVRSRGLAQVSDQGAILAAIEAVLAASPAEVERHRSGAKDLTGFFVGQVMRSLKGKGNPAVVNALLVQKLGAIVPGKGR
jgi:aspartyl-tRNA(Asn)/glutamyl-tRNA(Gln) amidotransferase subunit B